MVMISRALLSSGIFIGLLQVASAKHNGVKQHTKEVKAEDVLLEDSMYWGRTLRQLQMSVAPTPSPTGGPKIDVRL